MSSSELEVVLDDGVMPRKMKADALVEGIEAARRVYRNCRGRQSVCYAAAVGELLRAFGSLAANLIYDEGLTSFIVKLADGRLFLYDAERGAYKVVEVAAVVKALV